MNMLIKGFFGRGGVFYLICLVTLFGQHHYYGDETFGETLFIGELPIGDHSWKIYENN